MKYIYILYSLDSFATNRRNTHTIALTLLIVRDSTQIANQNSFDKDKKSLVTCIIMVHTCDEHKHIKFNKLIQAHIKENVWVNSMPFSKWTSWSCLLWLHCLTCFKTYRARKQSCNYFNYQIMAVIVFGIIFEIV
jgi:hypothetical protein